MNIGYLLKVCPNNLNLGIASSVAHLWNWVKFLSPNKLDQGINPSITNNKPPKIQIGQVFLLE